MAEVRSGGPLLPLLQMPAFSTSVSYFKGVLEADSGGSYLVAEKVLFLFVKESESGVHEVLILVEWCS